MDTLPTTEWTVERRQEFFSSLGLDRNMNLLTWSRLFYDVDTLQRLVTTREVLDRICAWQHNLVAALSQTRPEEFVRWVSSHSASLSEMFEIHPWMLELRHGCTLRQANAAYHDTDNLFFFYLVDIRNRLMLSRLFFFYPGMSRRQVHDFLDQASAVPLIWNEENSPTMQECLSIVADLTNESDLAIRLRDLAAHARTSILALGEDFLEWLDLVGGVAARQLYSTHRPAFIDFYDQFETDIFGLYQILNTINKVVRINDLGIRRTLTMAGDQEYHDVRGSIPWLSQSLTHILNEHRKPDSRQLCLVTSLLQGFGAGKSQLVKCRIKGHCLIVIDGWMGENSKVPPRALDSMLCSIIRNRVNSVAGLKGLLENLGLAINRALFNGAKELAGNVNFLRLEDLGFTENNIEDILFPTDQRLGRNIRPIPTADFPWIVFDEARQVFDRRYEEDGWDAMDALRLIMSDRANEALNSFGVIILETTNELSVLHPPSNLDPVIRFKISGGAPPETRMPRPLVLHHNFDSLAEITIDGIPVRPKPRAIRGWNEFIWSKRHLDGLTFLGRPQFGAIFLGYFRGRVADGTGHPFRMIPETEFESLLAEVEARRQVRNYVRFQMCRRRDVIANDIERFVLSDEQPEGVPDEDWIHREEFVNDLAFHAFGPTCGALNAASLQTQSGLFGRSGAFLEAYFYPTGSLRVSFQSEPVLAGFACNLLAHNALFTHLLNIIHWRIAGLSVISEGPVGEFIARVLLMKTVVHVNREAFPATTADDFVGSEHPVMKHDGDFMLVEGVSKYFSPVSASAFLKTLIGETAWRELEQKAAPFPNVKSVLNGHVAFSHFSRMGRRSSDANVLVREALLRNMAIIGYTNMPCADLVIPCVSESGKLTTFLVSVKNDLRYKSADLRRRSMLAPVWRHAEQIVPSNVFKKSRPLNVAWERVSGGDILKAPFVSIMFCLRGEGDAANHSRVFIDADDNQILIVIYGIGSVQSAHDPFSAVPQDARQTLINMLGLDDFLHDPEEEILRRDPTACNHTMHLSDHGRRVDARYDVRRR